MKRLKARQQRFECEIQLLELIGLINFEGRESRILDVDWNH